MQFTKEEALRLASATKHESGWTDTKWKEMKALAGHNGVSYITYNKRVVREGLTPYQAATKAVEERGKVYVVGYEGKTFKGTRKEICKDLGLNYSTVAARMTRKKLAFEEALKEMSKSVKNVDIVE